MSQPLNVVIVGGSLGGLFNGIALSRRGHRVTILERNPTPLMHDQGAGIVAGSDVQEFFNRYDRTRTPLAVTSHARQYLNRSGDVIDYEQRAQKMTSWDLLYHLLRANFDGIDSPYATAAPKEPSDGTTQYLYNHTVTALEDLGANHGVRITSHPTTTSSTAPTTTTPADLLIAADGASSTIRAHLLPSAHRTYAGYVAWRGTLPESSLSAPTAATLAENFTFFHAPATQILAYLIPGAHGSTAPGERLLNWVWYVNHAEHGDELRDQLTDDAGATHRVTLPPGGVRAAVWARVRARAAAELPPQFAEAVRKTEAPFVQKVTDVVPERAAWWGGRCLLVGDALAGFRPHTAASTGQAAFDAEMVGALVSGECGLGEWEARVVGFAREVQKRGVVLGDRSQFGRHPFGG